MVVTSDMRFLVLASWLAIVAAGPVRAADAPVPVCASPAVLRHVADTLRHAGRQLALEVATVGQVSIDPAGAVHCAVRTHALVYDTNRYGVLPLDQSDRRAVYLELRQNGIFLHID